jgi:hypothetical protein
VVNRQDVVMNRHEDMVNRQEVVVKREEGQMKMSEVIRNTVDRKF